jgi:hypothetical protein
MSITPAASTIVHSINAKTTPDEFDKLRAAHPDYKITDEAGGFTGNAFMEAVYQGNVPLAEHIVKIAGKEIASLGSGHNKAPPIRVARRRKDAPMLKFLLSQGAIPEKSTIQLQSDLEEQWVLDSVLAEHQRELIARMDEAVIPKEKSKMDPPALSIMKDYAMPGEIPTT